MSLFAIVILLFTIGVSEVLKGMTEMGGSSNHLGQRQKIIQGYFHDV